ncbi:MAG: hypothetical protein KatS3mg111_1616 [Pirellulaceae bacterium]|nr:MAG: hypothetical protein KatS3mg111_1616 [Pirellulaceae bacterium]
MHRVACPHVPSQNPAPIRFGNGDSVPPQRPAGQRLVTFTSPSSSGEILVYNRPGCARKLLLGCGMATRS